MNGARPVLAPEIQNLQGLAYDEFFPSLLPMLVKEGIAAPEHISELAPDLYRALDAQAIQSVLFLPFYVDERLEGFLGFDEMRHPRKWLPEEIAAIRAFGQSCVSVFERAAFATGADSGARLRRCVQRSSRVSSSRT